MHFLHDNIIIILYSTMEWIQDLTAVLFLHDVLFPDMMSRESILLDIKIL